MRAIADMGFLHPTPIQQRSIPLVMAGKDVMGCAETGTGKTASFLLPAMHNMIGRKAKGTRMLVLEPTRELAAQIEVHFKDLGRHTSLRAATVYGGVGFGPQTTALRAGYDIIVATPGRLLDHMGRGNARFNTLELLVLDEADRMLDMGFIPDIRRILRKLPKKRQSLFFSATLPHEVGRLSGEILQDPVAIEVGRKPKVAAGITHAIYPVAQTHKTAMLTLLLRTTEMGATLVFTRTKFRADRLADRLKSSGFSITCIHGDRTQQQRDKALSEFRTGVVQVLVATDVAARGLDIEGITHVINYDVPPTAEDYVHRCGRTGRAQKVGDAFTLVAFEEEAAMKEIERALSQTLPRVIRPDFDYGVMQPLPPATASKPPSSEGMHSTRRPRRRRR